MREILFQYQSVYPTTWAYLSSLLMIGLFFKFNRFWSVRNADLLLLILLAPGLLVAYFGYQHVAAAEDALELEQAAAAASGEGAPPVVVAEGEGTEVPDARTPAQRELQRARNVRLFGFAWLLGVSLLLLLRLLIDPTMVRRPLLEPNLSTGGLSFIGCSLFVFLMANVITSVPADKDGPRAEELIGGGESGVLPAGSDYPRHGPGYYVVLNLLPSLTTMPLDDPGEDPEVAPAATAKALAILSHLAIVLGIVAIGYRHFGNLKTGIGCATLYLMLPYTALMTGRIDHCLPAALLTWAVVCYRRPLTAGVLLGLAAGVIYYPLFVFPLWISFYWQRGLMRFLIGLLCSLAIMVIGLAVTPGGPPFVDKLVAMFGIWAPRMSGLEGVWANWDPIYRAPVIVAFVALSLTFAIWPAQKNLGTLLSCSAALMVAAQCWHGYGGGMFMAWYLPLLLLTVFRPNLEDRVALSVLSEGWFPRRSRVGGAVAA